MRVTIPIKIVLLVELVIIAAFAIISYQINHELLEYAQARLISQGNGLAHGFLQSIQALEVMTPEHLKEQADALTEMCQELYAKRHQLHGLTHVSIIDNTAVIVGHYQPEMIGTPLTSSLIEKHLGWQQTRIVLDNGVYHVLVPILSEQATSYQVSYLSKYIGAIDIGFAQTEVLAFFRPSFQKVLIILSVTAVLFLPLFFGIVYWLVSRPIAYLAQVGDQIGQGQPIETLHYTSYHDERALLARTFVKISDYFREVSRLATQIATGRLDQQEIQKHSKRDVLGIALQEMLNYLRTVADIARKVADGDLTMMAPLRSDYDAFGRALQQMILSLRQMAELATNISAGDLRDQIEPRSEQDSLGLAFQSMTFYLKRLAAAATAIAAGDLKQEIRPESAHDVLGNAFHTMAIQLRENFERIQQEVAERTRAQEALQELNAQLEERVKERTFELSAAYQEIQILNENLKEENVRLGVELNVARQIQQMILPRPAELNQIEALEIAGVMEPATEVGGDYYDLLRSCDDARRWYLGIGDVTGHGLESGIIMLMTQTAARTLIDRGETDPKIFLQTLNRVLFQNIQRMGIDHSVMLAFLEYCDQYVRLIGQHEEVLVVRSNGAIERVSTMGLGFPLGMVEDISEWVHAVTVQLQPGDGIVLYTDGIPEAENAEHLHYGIDRLCAVISQHWEEPAEAIKQAIVTDVKQFIGQQTIYDDMTLLIMKQR